MIAWTPRAKRRMQQIHDRMAQDQPADAARWVAGVLTRSALIGTQSRLWQKVPGYTRGYICEFVEGDYRIIYRIRCQRMDVITVHRCAPRLPEKEQLQQRPQRPVESIRALAGRWKRFRSAAIWRKLGGGLRRGADALHVMPGFGVRKP